MPQSKTKSKKKSSMLGESFSADNNTVYVYRDRGDGRPDGSNIAKYDHPIEKADLEKDLPPGMYVIITKNDDGGVSRDPVILAGNPDKTKGAGTNFKELMEMQVLANTINPRPTVDPLELVRTIGEVLKPGGGQAGDGMGHFYEGVNFGSETGGPPDPAAMLAQWGLQQADTAKGDNRLKKLEGAISKAFAIIAKKITLLSTEVTALKTQIDETTIDELEVPENEGVSTMQNPMDLITTILELDPEQLLDKKHVMNLLNLADKATDGAITTKIKELAGADLEEYFRAALEARNKAQCLQALIVTFREYAGITA